jgi:hypothetical protein
MVPHRIQSIESVVKRKREAGEWPERSNHSPKLVLSGLSKKDVRQVRESLQFPERDESKGILGWEEVMDHLCPREPRKKSQTDS